MGHRWDKFWTFNVYLSQSYCDKHIFGRDYLHGQKVDKQWIFGSPKIVQLLSTCWVTRGPIQTKILILILTNFCPVIFLVFQFGTWPKMGQKLDNIGHMWTRTGLDWDSQRQMWVKSWSRDRNRTGMGQKMDKCRAKWGQKTKSGQKVGYLHWIPAPIILSGKTKIAPTCGLALCICRSGRP